MNLAAIQDVFQHWLTVLGDQGIVARHANDCRREADGPVSEGLVIVTLLTSARLDPERRANNVGRQRSGSRPLARMQYVVAACGSAAPFQKERALLTLLVEAEAHPEIHILSEPVSASWWLAHDLSPSPAFQLEACVTEEVKVPSATLVKDIAVDMHRSKTVDGLVVWDDGRPIPGAEVKLKSNRQAVYSDANGRFRVTLMSGDIGNESVSVHVHNHAQVFVGAEIITDGGRWLLRVKLPHGEA